VASLTSDTFLHEPPFHSWGGSPFSRRFRVWTRPRRKLLIADEVKVSPSRLCWERGGFSLSCLASFQADSAFLSRSTLPINYP